MSDLSITAANVVKHTTGAKTRDGILGATLTAGQAVYRDTSDGNKLKAADCDSATAIIRSCYGILLNGGAAGQPATVQYGGKITIGGTVVSGIVYVLSDTPGGIKPAADLASGDYTLVLGVGISATQIELIENFFAPGVAV